MIFFVRTFRCDLVTATVSTIRFNYVIASQIGDNVYLIVVEIKKKILIREDADN